MPTFRLPSGTLLTLSDSGIPAHPLRFAWCPSSGVPYVFPGHPHAFPTISAALRAAGLPSFTRIPSRQPAPEPAHA